MGRPMRRRFPHRPAGAFGEAFELSLIHILTRRNIELILLCVAAPLVVLPFAMLALNDGQALTMNTLGVPLGIFVAFVLAHLSVRKFAPGADPAILPLAFALSGIGIAFVTRLAPDLAMRQVMWLFLGVVCMVVVLALLRNVDRLANYKYTLMIAGFVLLLSPMLPLVGQEINGSRIWLGIPGVISFQPGEIAKIAIVLFLAGYLAQNREMLSVFTWRIGPFRLPDIRTLLPLLLMWALAMVIVVFEKDLGSALVLFFVFLVMLYACLLYTSNQRRSSAAFSRHTYSTVGLPGVDAQKAVLLPSKSSGVMSARSSALS